jgi:hypothetical protein
MAAMPITHVVQQGDCFSKIARRYGFADYKLLYNDPANAELKKKRPNPNVLKPGDRIQIPDRTPKETSVETGSKHTFKVKVAEKMLRIVLQGHDGKALGGVQYELDVGEKKPRKGTTDGGGKLEEAVPADCTTATLTAEGRMMVLNLGHLNPLAEVKQGDFSGVQGRLKNLGYDPGPADGKLGPRTRAALAVFQADQDMDMTGATDDATLAKLEKAHGS